MVVSLTEAGLVEEAEMMSTLFHDRESLATRLIEELRLGDRLATALRADDRSDVGPALSAHTAARYPDAVVQQGGE